MTEIFNYQLSANQGPLTASVYTEIAFDTMVTDSAGVVTASQFVVPSSMNGWFGNLVAGIQLTATATGTAQIRRSTNGGSTWTVYAEITFNTAVKWYNLFTGPVPLVTGDVWDVSWYSTGTPTVAGATPSTFFSGFLSPSTNAQAFRYTNSGAQAVPIGNTEIVLDTMDLDTYGSGFASNRFTVPAYMNGWYAQFAAGIYVTIAGFLANNPDMIIERSTDSGSSWETLGTQGFRITSSPMSMNAVAGPIVLVTGHIYRLSIYFPKASTVGVDMRTFLAAYLSP